jgi:hypothetical protein
MSSPQQPRFVLVIIAHQDAFLLLPFQQVIEHPPNTSVPVQAMKAGTSQGMFLVVVLCNIMQLGIDDIPAKANEIKDYTCRGIKS